MYFNHVSTSSPEFVHQKYHKLEMQEQASSQKNN